MPGKGDHKRSMAWGAQESIHGLIIVWNNRRANQFLTKEYRKGWELPV
jgi:hypothetical protein